MLTDIAKVAHEANKAYCETLGDNSQTPWEDAPDWQKDSAVNGVMSIQTGEITKPEESHENWLKEKDKNGWIYGEVKDAELKTHPCITPFDKLPKEQQMKDHLFFQIVSTLLGQ
ncbi:hypothetical protein LCGC14_2710430 [marine sediment metagenome]|uniref:Ryanodine receptor Ryr domain-containing protein n=1 Tax=marine sediment metagenome TaxID=412755 RepID=A0A0F9BM30_9ZZZZ